MVSGLTIPAGHIRHGTAQRLIEASARDGRALSEREIRYRLQAGRAYPTRDQIGRAIADFSTWYDLAFANFPAFPAPEGALPYDPSCVGF